MSTNIFKDALSNSDKFVSGNAIYNSVSNIKPFMDAGSTQANRVLALKLAGGWAGAIKDDSVHDAVIDLFTKAAALPDGEVLELSDIERAFIIIALDEYAEEENADNELLDVDETSIFKQHMRDSNKYISAIAPKHALPFLSPFLDPEADLEKRNISLMIGAFWCGAILEADIQAAIAGMFLKAEKLNEGETLELSTIERAFICLCVDEDNLE